MAQQLDDETTGEIVTPVVTDGATFWTILCDSSKRIIVLLGHDGTNYVPLATDASGRLEVEIKGAA